MKHLGPVAILLVAAAVVAAAFLVFWLPGRLDPWRLPASDWRLFKKRFLSSEGRIVDTGNGGISHSEGQGYGMLLAEAFNDRRAFDKIWSWTRANLQTRPDDRLLSWSWKPEGSSGQVNDPNNASDGEILVAWALTRAAARWNDYSYQQAAAGLLVELRRLAVHESGDARFLLPGATGFVDKDTLVLNPSYYVFPALRQFGADFPAAGWKNLHADGLELVGSARFSKWNLTPDWVAFSQTYSLDTPFPPVFGYNAVRVPLHVAWDNPKSPLLAPFAAFWKEFPDPKKIPATVDLKSDTFGPDPSLPGMQAIARFVLACHAGERVNVRDIPPVNPEEPYYSASLKLLTKVAIREALGGKK